MFLVGKVFEVDCCCGGWCVHTYIEQGWGGEPQRLPPRGGCVRLVMFWCVWVCYVFRNWVFCIWGACDMARSTPTPNTTPLPTHTPTHIHRCTPAPTAPCTCAGSAGATTCRAGGCCRAGTATGRRRWCPTPSAYTHDTVCRFKKMGGG